MIAIVVKNNNQTHLTLTRSAAQIKNIKKEEQKKKHYKPQEILFR